MILGIHGYLHLSLPGRDRFVLGSGIAGHPGLFVGLAARPCYAIMQAWPCVALTLWPGFSFVVQQHASDYAALIYAG